jgi:CRISPR-associated endonuclease/helicase Cas3
MRIAEGSGRPLDGVWAKLEPREHPRSWHPLVDHSHDVAACVQALLRLPLIAGRLARLAGRATVPDLWQERLVVLAFLHDFGKANHAFQERRGGHIAEASPLLKDLSLAEAAGLVALDQWFADGQQAVEALAAIPAHHGAPPPLPRDGTPAAFVQLWQASGPQNPPAIVRELVEVARQTWPGAFVEAGEPLPQAPTFWHGFLGLLQLADWLGSDAAPDAFPFSEAGDPPRHALAREAAERLTRELGLDALWLRKAMPAVRFEAIAGGQFPARPIQVAAATAAGSIIGLESETGSGKTERGCSAHAEIDRIRACRPAPRRRPLRHGRPTPPHEPLHGLTSGQSPRIRQLQTGTQTARRLDDAADSGYVPQYQPESDSAGERHHRRDACKEQDQGNGDNVHVFDLLKQLVLLW